MSAESMSAKGTGTEGVRATAAGQPGTVASHASGSTAVGAAPDVRDRPVGGAPDGVVGRTAAPQPPAGRSSGRVRGPDQGGSPARQALRYALLIILALIFVSPLIFMLVTSFKTRAEAGGIPP